MAILTCGHQLSKCRWKAPCVQLTIIIISYPDKASHPKGALTLQFGPSTAFSNLHAVRQIRKTINTHTPAILTYNNRPKSTHSCTLPPKLFPPNTSPSISSRNTSLSKQASSKPTSYHPTNPTRGNEPPPTNQRKAN